MKQESTYVAAEIAAADSEMQTDLACKKVLAAREILSRIIQGAVREYKDYTPDEIAERFIDTVQIQLFSQVSPGMTNHRDTILEEQTEDGVQNEATYGIPMKRKLIEEVGNMCTYSAAIRERAEEEGREEGRKEGRKEGKKEGRKEGQDRINSLYQRLKTENRMEDLMRAIDDLEYQNQLLKEYGL